MITTLCPGKRVLERVEEVKDDPGYDDIVIEANVHDDEHGGKPHSSEVGEKFLPH